MAEPLRRRRTPKPIATAAPPADLVAAPGYGARRMYQAYLSAWSRHVDAVLTGDLHNPTLVSGVLAAALAEARNDDFASLRPADAPWPARDGLRTS